MTFQESQPSALWFQPVRGLCACSQHVVTFFHLGRGFLVSIGQQGDMHQIVRCIP